ncbi:alpha/beta fold hydrolase [Acerihabitans arboris]|uniref:alpha/beta fold hydrolase n=1 Tax=Acerihabitans arboris TaxID=2691583 RepID=UPI0028A8B434|nr:alpha/beta fold hydrolase [Acerihabitans arboris]
MLTHGWPGSFLEMQAIIPMLTDPARFGGDARDAFHVVVPSLPGYGFSAAPAAKGTGSYEVAGLWAELMTGLGYQRFGAQGGDIGAGVSSWLACRYPDRIAGLHLNFIPGSYRPSPAAAILPPWSARRRWRGRYGRFSSRCEIRAKHPGVDGARYPAG